MEKTRPGGYERRPKTGQGPGEAAGPSQLPLRNPPCGRQGVARALAPSPVHVTPSNLAQASTPVARGPAFRWPTFTRDTGVRPELLLPEDPAHINLRLDRMIRFTCRLQGRGASEVVKQ